jgi:hypothetical protein
VTGPDELNELFHATGNDARAWWFTGMNLLVAAEVLRRSGTVTLPVDEIPDDGRAHPVDVSDEEMLQLQVAMAVAGPALMLRAFGVEALLKAVYLDRGGVLARGGRYVAPTNRPHDLGALAGAVSVDVAKSAATSLAKLEYWIQQGRYPIQSRLTSYSRVGGDAAPMRYEWTDVDEQAWREFKLRLQQLGAPIKTKWVDQRAVEQGDEADER